jgi:hypothetical protein
LPAPKPKQPIEFPDPGRHTDLVDLRKQIRETILDLRTVMHKGEDENILVEFTSVIHPGSFADPGRLPRDSTDGRSRNKRKEECLYATISTMIQTYWDLVLMPDSQYSTARLTSIKAELVALKEVNRGGLTPYRVEGDDRKGYVLIR